MICKAASACREAGRNCEAPWQSIGARYRRIYVSSVGAHKEAGMTTMAKEIGVSRHTLYRYEWGDDGPLLETAVRMARACGFKLLVVPEEVKTYPVNEAVSEPREAIRKQIRRSLSLAIHGRGPC
jgi:DNA-binding XRE family transcriptional regulator